MLVVVIVIVIVVIIANVIVILTLRRPPRLLRGRGHGTHVGSVGACPQQKPRACGRKTGVSLHQQPSNVTCLSPCAEGGGVWGG